MEIDPQVKQALLNIDFIKRYEALSKEYDLERLGDKTRLKYIPVFDPKEKFFKFYQEIGDYTFGLHFILYNGTVDFIWAVTKGKQVLAGAPWGVYSKRLIDPSYRIKKPIFSDYDELEDILKTAFKIYEDFKQVFLEIAEQK